MHILREIDEGNCTAVCAICGPTDVYRFTSKGQVSYRCATSVRALERLKCSGHIVNPYATVHVLSEIDEGNRTAVCAKCGPVRIHLNDSLPFAAGHPDAFPGSRSPRFKYGQAQEGSKIITEYKRRRACKRCGSLAVLEPDRFSFFELHLPQERRISALVKTAGPEELLAELETRDLYCHQCLGLVMHAFENNTEVPAFRPFPTLF